MSSSAYFKSDRITAYNWWVDSPWRSGWETLTDRWVVAPLMTGDYADGWALASWARWFRAQKVPDYTQAANAQGQFPLIYRYDEGFLLRIEDEVLSLFAAFSGFEQMHYSSFDLAGAKKAKGSVCPRSAVVLVVYAFGALTSLQVTANYNTLVEMRRAAIKADFPWEDGMVGLMNRPRPALLLTPSLRTRMSGSCVA